MGAVAVQCYGKWKGRALGFCVWEAFVFEFARDSGARRARIRSYEAFRGET